METRPANLHTIDRIEKISVIIPTFNGAFTLPDLFEGLRKQTRQPDEVIVVDSSSSDNTEEIARSFGAKIVLISTDCFDHGGTRTEIGRQACGDILVYMTQDAVPADQFALERLVEPLCGESKASVAYGRQLPNRDASLFAEHIRLFNYGTKSYLRSWHDRKRYGLRTAFVSNSFAAYKKHDLEKCDYFQDGLIFGEDVCVVTRLLKTGSSIAYVADGRVYHSHNYSVFQDFKRYFDIGVFHQRQKWLIDDLGRPEGEGFRYLRSELFFLKKRKKLVHFPEFLLRIGGKFIGYKLGSWYELLPKRIVLFCSMNRRFWLK